MFTKHSRLFIYTSMYAKAHCIYRSSIISHSCISLFSRA